MIFQTLSPTFISVATAQRFTLSISVAGVSQYMPQAIPRSATHQVSNCFGETHSGESL